MTITTGKIAGASAFAFCSPLLLPRRRRRKWCAYAPRSRASTARGHRKIRDGVEMKVKLADNGPVNRVVKSLARRHQTISYVAVTAMPQPDGSQKATAVIIFPEADRGVGEGHRPWDFSPNSTMTNATVDSTVTSVDGQNLCEVQGRRQDIIVPPTRRNHHLSKKSLADLKPGDKIFVAGAKKLDDGTLEAAEYRVRRLRRLALKHSTTNREDEMKKRILGTAFILAAILTAAPALSQTPPARVRGTIEKIDGSDLTIKARDGSSVNVKLADNPRITAMVKASLDDIKTGTFIGVTAMPQPDGSQKAIGLHIFMDNQRGVVPARFSPWDREPGSTMTNADVKSTVASVDGQTLMVKYSDGEKKIIVPPNTPVVKFVPGNAGDLKVGAQVAVLAGPETAGRIDRCAGDQCRPRWRGTADVTFVRARGIPCA